MGRFVQGEFGRPIGVQAAPAGPDVFGEMLAYAVRHQERLVLGPTIRAFGQADFFVAQRRSVRFVRVGFVRRSVSDNAPHDNQRRAVVAGAERGESCFQSRHVVRVLDRHRVPSQTVEPRGHILTECQVGVAFDRDLVVVVDPTEIGQLQVPRDRSRFAADAFHEVPVAAQRVHIVTEQVETRLVIACGEPLPGHGHAYAGADALTQRPGRHLDSRRFAILRMPGAGATQLTKVAKVVQRNGRPVQHLAVLDFADSNQVQYRVQQHRGVSAGQDKPVPRRPPRVFRVVAHLVIPDGVGHWRQGHRGSRVAAIGFLDPVHRQGADRVDGQLP